MERAGGARSAGQDEIPAVSVRVYSGRAMYGRHCLAAVIPSVRCLAQLGPGLRIGLEVDDFAFDVIACWPEVLVPESHELRQERDG